MIKQLALLSAATVLVVGGAAIPSNAAVCTAVVRVANSVIADGVTTAAIEDGAVTTPKLASDAVTEAKIITGAVTTNKLADDACSTAKIINDAVTEAKIVNAAVTTAKLATDSVITAKILNGAVTTDKLSSDSVSESKILNGSVTTDKIGDDSVTEDKILSAAVTTAKLDSESLMDPNKNASFNNLTIAGQINSVPASAIYPILFAVAVTSETASTVTHYSHNLSSITFHGSLDGIYFFNLTSPALHDGFGCHLTVKDDSGTAFCRGSTLGVSQYAVECFSGGSVRTNIDQLVISCFGELAP